MAERTRTFKPIARQRAYIRVNEKLVDRLLSHLPERRRHQLLDVAAGSGLMTDIARARAGAWDSEIDSVLVDVDPGALREARGEVPPEVVRGWVCASADRLPFREAFDLAIFANCIHLLDARAKTAALAEIRRVLRPAGLLAVNTAFYEGSVPEGSRPFYGRWIRRAVGEINRSRPRRTKSDRAQATSSLSASQYCELVAAAGFQILETRERRVLLSPAAVRAISSYTDFAMGALRATEEDAEEAARVLQMTVQATFRDLHITSLPRRWLEIIAARV